MFRSKCAGAWAGKRALPRLHWRDGQLLKSNECTLAALKRAWGAIRIGAFLAVLLCPSPAARAQQQAADLTERSLEDLMNVEVTSVSKKPEKLSRTASAVFVITQEDIRRSGATDIPDLLRMVPGIDVAQIDANAWAVSARGLNGRFSNELLVLVDGRSLYTSSFGGVFWDVVDLPIEDIERIEVIRGPGGSSWGANAVNGVINIITKNTSDTLGGLAVSGGATFNRDSGQLNMAARLAARQTIASTRSTSTKITSLIQWARTALTDGMHSAAVSGPIRLCRPPTR
jgi:outer membrane receptor for ferrienterochelin and colicin